MSSLLADRLTRQPVACEPEGVLPAALSSAPLGPFLAAVAGSSPFLARLMRREHAWLAGLAEQSPEAMLDALLADLRSAMTEIPDMAGAARALRVAKGRAALLIALADLSGAWPLGRTTGALSILAETAVSSAVDFLLRIEAARGRLDFLDDAAPGRSGYVVIAMGKLGAGELNFSSDIDLICVFDQDRMAPGAYAEAKQAYIRLTRALVKLLSDQTADGYVFRTDLRLRPNPSTTAVCVAMEAAERYYEAEGRTWERAAHIKARCIAGDLAAGRAYLDRLTPFVWRRYLDFAAIEDTHGMLKKIREKKGRFRPGDVPGADIKLDPGGIREIEFFAQTRQLIFGGRDPSLRQAGTVAALDALAEAGQVPRFTAERLTADYIAHRDVEHRLQMIEDAQTQTVPTTRPARERIARLMGMTDLDAWEVEIADRMERVHRTCEGFFAPAHHRPSEEVGAERLAKAGFQRPEEAMRLIGAWRAGKIAATRAERAAALYARLEPRIVSELAAAGPPDEAIIAFDRFLSALPAGVQVFSLFQANPHLLQLIVSICAAAPRLAGHLGRESRALDALLARDFFQPMPDRASLSADLEAWLAEVDDYERVLDAVRVWAREQRFRLGVQVLRGIAEEEEAGRGFSAIAEASIGALLPRVIAEFAARHGDPPGGGIAVLALGKLGTREMTSGSDLDLILVYDPGEAESSEGPRPLPPATYYPRLTQAFLSSLTAPTAEGTLYEVDMRLRPSGRQGPVAVSLAGFARYQRDEAWVWEHMALTRARIVAGPPALSRGVEAAIEAALAKRKGSDSVLAEAREMRARLLEAHGRERRNPWSFKLVAGGLMEIEFLAQTGQLQFGAPRARGAARTLPHLVRTGWLTEAEAEELGRTHALLLGLQQIERVALDQPFVPETAGAALIAAFAKAAGCRDLAALAARLGAAETRAAVIVARVIEGETWA